LEGLGLIVTRVLLDAARFKGRRSRKSSHERKNFFMLTNLIGQGKVRCVFSVEKN
jgi:hypothetical protein